MHTKIIEVTNGPANWGKFMVGVFTSEDWQRRSEVSPMPQPLLHQIGFGNGSVWVLDLQTCEGACFKLGGLASADLNKHRVWVCPLFEPFLTWLYTQSKDFYPPDIDALPSHIDLADAPFAMQGYRRPGPPTP